MSTPVQIEYLYAIDHCRGSLDCWTAYVNRPITAEEHWAGHLVRFRITRRTAKRVYYRDRGRERFTSRADLESTGRSGFGRKLWEGYLYAAEPPMPEHQAPKRPDVKALKAAMADAHPDRGGSAEQFGEARRRYLAARTAGGGR